VHAISRVAWFAGGAALLLVALDSAAFVNSTVDVP
jgi:hypothetical protein